MTINVTFGEIPFNVPTALVCRPEEFRENIIKLQEVMLDMEGCQIEPPVSHYFAPGLYARVMDIAAGVTVVGKIHKHSHINVISKGIVDVMTEFGKIRYKAPVTFVSEAGTKRHVTSITNVVWTTIHAADHENIALLEKEMIADDYDELLREVN